MCQFCLSCAHLNSKLHQRCDKPTSHGFMPTSVVRELNFKRPAFCLLSLVQVLKCSVDLETVFGNKVFLSVSLRETLETSYAVSPILANALTVDSLRLIGSRLRLARSIQNIASVRQAQSWLRQIEFGSFRKGLGRCLPEQSVWPIMLFVHKCSCHVVPGCYSSFEAVVRSTCLGCC